MKQSKGEKLFQIFNCFFLVLLSLITLYPFWEVLKVSFSHPLEASRIGFSLFPRELSFSSYSEVLRNEYIWIGYRNTFIRILLGLGISMALKILTAYPLSRKYFPNRSFWTLFIVFTMFFHGGLIPDYLLVTNILGLTDSIWAMLLPGAISSFHLLIIRNYFMTLPASLEESAKMDGAGQLTILICIILPLSMPILMTVGLWTMVSHWNAWFDCILYIRDSNKYVLQAILRKIVIELAPQFAELVVVEDNTITPSSETVKCAVIIVSTVPILCVYPFIQKYFVKGVIMGSLKG